MKILKWIIGIMLTALSTSCLKETQLSIDNDLQPLQLNDGWESSTLINEHIDETTIRNAFKLFFDGTTLPLAKSLLVIRNGKIVAEAYKDQNRHEAAQTIANVQSCTKSITSILLGIALNESGDLNTDVPLLQFFPPDYQTRYADKASLTIKDCLTMQDGISYNGLDDARALVYTKKNSIEHILETPRTTTTPAFKYSEYPPHLISGLISQLTGEKLAQYAEERVFSELGIQDYYWETSNDGLNIGGFSLSLSPRSLAKIGQLCLQNGQWNGQTVISQNWLVTATSKQSISAAYGYFFYINENDGSYSMRGNGGQTVHIVPSKNLVIVYTAFPYSSNELWGNNQQLIDLIKSACQ
ncbi:serine hydrolase domain-containing protein [Parapedobacter koreensis]|uniref:CubicO group peptidase, beta-lactamase class C family n=1 Tax=Parapedobacter koreensis TaxID=332977 RepID=A0A1H7NLX0_9SPHI|nr:serine hydrolase domain-containing protein [Parapedobacter koreensis]SEL24523.1 CubicO group peptidase, beta-lactamase class C family [Parapedobacter koreensis]